MSSIDLPPLACSVDALVCFIAVTAILVLLLSHTKSVMLIWGTNMSIKAEVWQGILKLEPEGAITPESGIPENNRRAKFYRIARAGQKQLVSEVDQWSQAAAIVARFIALTGAKA